MARHSSAMYQVVLQQFLQKQVLILVSHPQYSSLYSAQMVDENWVFQGCHRSTWVVLFAAQLAVHGSLHCLTGGSQMVHPQLRIQLHLHREMSPRQHHGLLVKLVKIAAPPFLCPVLEKMLVYHQAHHQNCFLGLALALSWAICFSSKLVLVFLQILSCRTSKGKSLQGSRRFQ